VLTITPAQSFLSFAAALLLAALGLALPASASASQTLTVQKAGAGNGALASSPAGIECGPTCKASFADNATVTIAATPDASSQAAKWSGCDSVNGEGKCEVTMSSARSVTATFDLLQRQLTVKKAGTATGTVKSSPAGIECGVKCSASYPNGTTVTLTGSPGLHALPAKWSGCGFVDAEDKCVVAMNAAKEVTATFDLSEPLLKVTLAGTGTGTVKSSPAGIECGEACSAKYLEGTTVTLSGAPQGEAEATIWSGCDSVTAEGKCVVQISSAREVTASFELPVLPLTITEVGTGTGTVTSTPLGIECPSSCAHSFVKGSTVTLKALSGLHTEAVQWSGCDKLTVKGECQVTISQTKAVIASFKLQPQWLEYTIAVQRTGTGQGTVESSPGGISCGEDCSETYLHFTQLTLSATPAPGSAFDHWSVASCGTSSSCEIAVNSSRTVKAVFDAIGTRTLTVAKAGSGQGTVTSANLAAIDCGNTCSAELEAGSKVTLKATPAQGSTFAGWSGGGCSGTGACKVTMSEAKSITASFAKPAPGPSELLVAGRAKVKAGRALLHLSCEGASPCRGSLRLLVKTRNAQGQAKGLVIAQGAYELAAGAHQTLEVKLSPRARRLLGGAESLRARVTGTGIDSHAVRLSA